MMIALLVCGIMLLILGAVIDSKFGSDAGFEYHLLGAVIVIAAVLMLIIQC